MDPHLRTLLLTESAGLLGTTRAGGDAEGWRVLGPPPFMSRQLGNRNSKRRGILVVFFFPSKAAKLCFLETCKSLLVFRKERRGIHDPTQQKRGTLGSVEEARDQPRLEAASRPSHQACPSLLGQELALQPSILMLSWAHHAATSWGAQQRGESRLLATAITLSFSSRSGCFQDFKVFHICSAGKKKKLWRVSEEHSWDWQAGSHKNCRSSVFPVHQHTREVLLATSL